MDIFSPETINFIRLHRTEDVRKLALQAEKYPKVNMTAAVKQIAGWQTARMKLPQWAQTEGIIYPGHLPMEQCSSETTAQYKASLAKGDTFVDLTGGLGVDCIYMARNFRITDYVERQEELCKLAAHNFPLLGMAHIGVHHADAVDYLKKMEPADCLFLDPARRNRQGGKTVAIADCEPDVTAIEPLLVEKGRTVIVKLSPMLDVSTAIRELKNVREIHIVAVDNECKELLAILRKSSGKDQEPTIVCEQASGNRLTTPFHFTCSQERDSVCTLADETEDYLYEPGAALLKAGPWRLLSERFSVKKLHSNSHLYTSSRYEASFPGRHFRVLGVSGFGKKELKSFLCDVNQANLTVRNFPSSVTDLRKRLKLKDGGEIYLFATTLSNGKKVLIKTKHTSCHEQKDCQDRL